MRGILLLLSLLVVLGGGAAAQGGSIHGGVFTAEDPDSIAPGCSVELIYRDAEGELRRVHSISGEDGSFQFSGLPTADSIGYVLQIAHRGRSFLSVPIRFEAGQEEIAYNVLLKEDDAGGDLPAGHPPLGAERAPARPVRQNPTHAILIVLWVVVLFTVFAFLARCGRRRAAGRELPLQAQAFIRDIASLDLRHEDGVIGEEEYRKVRAGLVERLRSLDPGGHTQERGG